MASRKYRVASAHKAMIDVPAKTSDGLDVVGRLACLHVELTPVDERHHHTITRRELNPSQATIDLFKVGNVVEEGEWRISQ
jgi:hypothetical protein